MKAVAQLALALARWPLMRLRGGQAYADYTYGLAGILGKLSFSPIHPIYRAADSNIPAAPDLAEAKSI